MGSRLWRGVVKQAQESYVRINRLGEAVTTWETLVIQHRDSAFVRVLMATVQIARMHYYWPDTDHHQTHVEELRAGIRSLHDTVFLPVSKAGTASSGVPLTYPLLHGTPDEKLEWFQEMMDIAFGGEGKASSMEQWLQPIEGEQLLTQGTAIVKQMRAALDHLTGESPKSLGMVPLLYTYNAQGTYVRGLLYGFWYWLKAGSADEVLARKRLFCVYRQQIEQVLLTHKAAIVHRYSRKVGSGPEVTADIAQFYQALLDLLMQHAGALDSSSVQSAIRLLLQQTRKSAQEEESSEEEESLEGESGERFTPKIKKAQRILTQLQSAPRCGVCEGLMDVARPTQDDHILERARGGKGNPTNGRLTHQFCNNNRALIEQVRAGTKTITLPLL
jgi:hypothetical protein